MLNLKELHEKFLYPAVRIFSNKAAGSGTVIWSKEDPENKEEFLTFVLTNHHVIADLITHKSDWDSILKKKIEKEFKEQAKVEDFSYVWDSTVDSSNRYSADIVAYDVSHDLAILKVDSPRLFQCVAPLIPKDKIKSLRLYMDIAVTGCTMAHEPFTTFGQLTFLKEIIEQKRYVMYNAGSYFGNSGGALFLRESGELIGVPSRLTGIQLGFGIDMVTHMGFASHPSRIYEFLMEQELCFLAGEADDDYYKAMKRREDKKKEALLELRAEITKSEDGCNI